MPTTEIIADRNSYPEGYMEVAKCNTVKFSDEDMLKIKTNLKLMLLVLRQNNFRNAARQLTAYAKEFAIL